MDQLAAAVTSRRNPVCVGLDPRWQQLPVAVASRSGDDFAGKAEAYRRFCEAVIDVVAPLVPVVKPQSAFFEELGPAGMSALAETIQYARRRGVLVILDGKRNDIGSTAEAYARGMLGRDSAWGADALTVSPYLGEDSLQPFVEVAQQRAAGIFVLVKTSNPGGGMLQDLPAQGTLIYRHVGNWVERIASQAAGEAGYGCVGAVAGATYPEQLAELRTAMPHTWFLVPGFGSQGGAAHDVAGAFDPRGLGAVVNNSRSIIFAHRRPEFSGKFADADWQRAVEAATLEMIQQLRDGTSVAAL